MLALLTLVLCGAWYVVFYTEYGLHTVLARITQLRSTQIRVDGASGTIGGRLYVKHFELDNQFVHVTADDIELAVTPRALFSQTLRAADVRIGAAAVSVKENNEPSDGAPLKFFAPFLLLQADAVDIGSARFVNYDGFTQTAQRVRARVRITAQRLQIDRAAVETDAFVASGYLALRAQRPIPIEANIALRAPARFGADLEGKLAASGTIERMNIEAALAEPSPARFVAEFVGATDHWQLNGTFTSEQFSLASWIERPPFSLHQTALDIALDSRDAVIAARITGATEIPEVDSEPLEVDVTGRYAERIVAITNATVQLSKSDTALSAAGRIAFNSGQSDGAQSDSNSRPQIDATAQWRNLRWPLRGEDLIVASDTGQISISGNWPFAVSVQADAIVQQNFPVQLSAQGGISETELRADQFTAQLLDGSVSGKGALQFKQQAWQAAVKAESLNLEPLHAALHGKLTFDANASGTGFNRDMRFALDMPMLRGELRGQQLTGRGALARDRQRWTARDIAISLGDARLEIGGTYADKFDVQWSLNAPELEDFIPGARGSLQTDGHMRGTLAMPHIDATLHGERLEYGAWRAAEIDARAAAHLAGEADSQLQVTVRDLHAGQVALGSPRLTASMAQQQQAAPAFDRREQWRIDRFCIDWPEQSNGENDLERRLCGDAAWSRDGAWTLQAQSGQLPLSMFDGSVPKNARYSGQWQVNVNAQASPSKAFSGTARVRVNNAALIHQPVEGEEETMQLGSGEVSLVADAAAFMAAAQLTTPGTTRIDADARIERSGEAEWQDLPLTGRLKASTADAKLLPLVFPDIDHSDGELTADLGVRGTTALPELSGRVEIKRGELSLYRYNLNLREMNVAANFVDNRLEFDGRALAGEGQMRIVGQLAWRDLQPHGNLHFTGERLTIADVPEYKILASPDVRFAISGTRINIGGEVFIPSARLQPTDLTGATQLSPDARLTSTPPADKRQGFDIHSEVRVRIGDDVLIDTLGLQGKLGGTVVTVAQPDERAIGRGELSVSDGRYEAYGQKLEIARGRLLFNSTPLDDPGLDIQAARRIEEQRVGVNVRGTLRAPRISLFAEPSLTQAQIVSYLLTGKPIDDMRSSDAQSVGLATDALALQGGGVLASQIGRRIGLEEVGIESRGVNDTSLVLGKFLSPRLFVSYGISLTESINTLKLRYTLSDKWLFKSEAGQNQSADLEFRIER